MRSDDTVAVLGPGAVGGFLAALLTRHGRDCVCVGNEAAVEAISRDGITIESNRLGVVHARPRAEAVLSEQVETLIIAVKAGAIETALGRIPSHLVQGALIVPLLNGFEHLALLKARFRDAAVVMGSIGQVELSRVTPTRIKHTSPSSQIVLGSDRPELRTRIDEFAALLGKCGIGTTVEASEASVYWRKLVRLNALACVTGASGLTLGAIWEDAAWRSKLESVLKETAAVALRDGVDVSVRDALKIIKSMPPQFTTSLGRDLEAGRRTEIEAIAGAVLRKAKNVGVPCEATAELYAAIRQKEDAKWRAHASEA